VSKYRIVAPRGSGQELTPFEVLITAQRNTLVSVPFKVDTAFLEVETWTVLAAAEATITIEIKGKWSHRMLPKEDQKQGHIYLVFDRSTLPVSMEELPTPHAPQLANCSIIFARETPLNALYVVHFRGMVGRGSAAIYIGRGVILGVDADLNRFKGQYFPENGALRIGLTITATEESCLVTGDLLKRGDFVSVEGFLSEDFEEGEFYEMRVAGKPVHIVFEKIGNIPGDTQ